MKDSDIVIANLTKHIQELWRYIRTLEERIEELLEEEE